MLWRLLNRMERAWRVRFGAWLLRHVWLQQKHYMCGSWGVSRAWFLGWGFTSCITRSDGGRKKEQEEEEEEKNKNPYLSTFVLIVFIKSSLSISRKEWSCPTIPAFANMTSNLPYSAIASWITAFTAASSAASNCRRWMTTSGYRELSSRCCAARYSLWKSHK